ncbi:MAG: hydrogenase maturation nickel metallochaperone HypA [Planctomycetes bacterium]|nr:hydrogenase maturation nickel metallochaperone HypA [Planctomycetota bacterium]
MHESGIVKEIIDIVKQRCSEHGANSSVKTVGLRVTRSGHVSGDSIKFLFESFTRDMPEFAGTVMEIEEIQPSVKCNKCTEVFTMEDVIPLCPKCGSTDIYIPEHIHDITLTTIELN